MYIWCSYVWSIYLWPLWLSPWVRVTAVLERHTLKLTYWLTCWSKHSLCWQLCYTDAGLKNHAFTVVGLSWDKDNAYLYPTAASLILSCLILGQQLPRFVVFCRFFAGSSPFGNLLLYAGSWTVSNNKQENTRTGWTIQWRASAQIVQKYFLQIM